MKTSLLSLVLVGALAAPSFAFADLIQNGSFEGAYGTSNFDGSDIPADWTLTPASDGGGSVWVGGLGSSNFDLGVAAEDGSSYLAFGAVGPATDTISQTAATLSGGSYNLSFWVDTDQAGGTPLEFSASWGADELLDVTAPLAASGWNEYSYTVTGTGADAVSFSAYDTDGYTLLDNVQLQPSPATVPEGGLGLPLTAGVLLALLACSAASQEKRYALISPHGSHVPA